MANDGSNSDPFVSQNKLKSYVREIEKLEEEKRETAEAIKEVYGRAKASGMDNKTIRTVIRLRKIEESKRVAEKELLDLYLSVFDIEY